MKSRAILLVIGYDRNIEEKWNNTSKGVVELEIFKTTNKI